MKKLLLTIGLLTFFLFPTDSWADFCQLAAEEPTFYRSSYCEIRLHGNSKMEKDIDQALEVQMQLPASVIQLFLDEGKNIGCGKVDVALEEEGLTGDDRPAAIDIACGSGSAVDRVNNLINLQNNLWIAYNKEKALQINQKKLEIEFRESEKYWDANLQNLSNTPFDLIVDLNLVENVLFGSQAQWTYDVFTFPGEEETDEEEGSPLGGGGAEGGGGGSGGEEGLVSGSGTSSSPSSIQPGAVLVSDEFIAENCLPNQGSAAAFPLCGNGTLDAEAGETCDDGNQQAGDGCSPSCVVEETGSGGLNMCIDPEAVTFRDYNDIEAVEVEAQEARAGGVCPPGTHLKPGVDVSHLPGQDDTGVEQSPNYPGPLVGGTLKQFPESSRPPCPPGQAEVEITLINGETKSACIPNETCTDFNKARGALFGEDWEQDEEKVAVARSIEALFCVEVITWDGPQNVFESGLGTQGLADGGGTTGGGSVGPNEGCVDCHIRGIAKSLEAALETNVAPMANTMGAFEMSQRFGPNVSFNLTAMTRSHIRARNLELPDQVEIVDASIEAAEKEAAEGESSIQAEEGASEALERRQENQQRITEARQQWLQDYGMRQDLAGDVSLNQTMHVLLEDMNIIFEGMHENYSSMADISARLASDDYHPICRFDR